MKKLIFILSLFFTSILITHAASCEYVTGDGTKIGDEIKCGSEHFYVISNDGVNIKMLGKYNLLVGSTYYRINFDTTLTNYRDIYGVKEVQEKILDGYSIYKSLYNYDDTTSTSTYYGAVMYKSYDWDSTNPTIFFDSPLSTIDEVLHRSDVQKYLDEGYVYHTYKLSDGTYAGVYFSKSDNYEYKTIVFDSPKTLLEAVKDDKVTELFESGYIYDSKISSAESDYIALRLKKSKDDSTTEYITIPLNTGVSTQEDLMKSSEVKEKLEEGYAFLSSISEVKNFVAATLYKKEGFEYKTLQLSTSYPNYYYTHQQIYNMTAVKELLAEGYKIDRYYQNSYSCWITNYYCGFEYYGILFSKSSEYEYLNIMFGEQISSDNLESYVSSNEEIQQKISDGYAIDGYYTITRYSSNTLDGYRYTTYAGIRLKLPITKFGLKNNSETKKTVYQDKSAIGAHGDEKGNPEPEEIGIVDYNAIWWDDSVTYETYLSGFSDYTYSATSDARYYFDSYYETLRNEGYDIQSVDSITVSEINEIVYKVSGEYLPLEDWYNNMSEISYDPVTNDDFYILGSLKDYLSDEYSWLWGTTYWTRTADPDFEYIYFVDTLGDLCAQEYCDSAIGAGLRPVVTIAVEDVIFRVDTKTDGNGTVEATHVEAKEGTVVQFTVTPNEGYVLSVVKVTDENGNVVYFYDNTFTMPHANVLIEATFVPINPETHSSIGLIILAIFGISGIIWFNNKKKADLFKEDKI